MKGENRKKMWREIRDELKPTLIQLFLRIGLIVMGAMGIDLTTPL